jgi:ribosomal protein S18 acetylase RimI-like enzyme
LDLYASTRAEELQLVAWTGDAKAAFIEQQFTAQDVAYRARYPDGKFLLIEQSGRPIGRLYLARLSDEIRVVDVTLVPDARGRGIGTALIGAVLAEAAGAGLAVRLHVEQWNRAMGWYERLGFRRLETRGIYEFMEWRAEGPQLNTAS